MRKVEWSTHKLEQEKSELNKRIEEEQISNSRDRKSLEKEWKTKQEKKKREHDFDLELLKGKGKSRQSGKRNLRTGDRKKKAMSGTTKRIL